MMIILKQSLFLMGLNCSLKKAQTSCSSTSASLHKYRNLIKLFMIVCGNRHILNIMGPYAATTNDADILKMILNNHGEPIEDCAWHYFFHQNDVMVLDRGFRDAIPQAEEYGYEVHMPASNRRGQRQLCTEDSNKSRLVTICRWVVEAINDRIKRDFKLFRATGYLTVTYLTSSMILK